MEVNTDLFLKLYFLMLYMITHTSVHVHRLDIQEITEGIFTLYEKHQKNAMPS